MQAAAFLARFGITVDQAADFILQRAADPAALFAQLREVGAGADMIARILQSRLAGVSADQVRGFFAARGLDSSELDAAYFDFVRRSVPEAAHGMTHDNLTGTAGADHINGGPGNDTINGLDGDDILIGGSGNDRLLGGWGADFLDGGQGADRLEGGEHSFWTQSRWVGNQWVPGHEVFDFSANVLVGGEGADTLIGGHGSDRLDGGDGADQLDGRAGHDTLLGGTGSDTLDGGLGADSLVGGDGDDRIHTRDRWSSDLSNDTVQAGAGNDFIEAQHNDDVDAGIGNDTIEVWFVSGADRRGVVVAGEGADRVELWNMAASHGVVVDLSETVQSRDAITWNLANNHGLTAPVLAVRGFSPQNDQFGIGEFHVAFTSTHPVSFDANSARGWNNANFTQILTDPSQAFLREAARPANPDQHGKGFFVIQGAAASADDTTTVAAFLDPYGNNHTCGNSLRHYFFINVGATDSALYLFRDDTGANNLIVSDELTPIARFVGLRTENFTSADLMNVFI